MKNKNYEVSFTDTGTMIFEAVSFKHSSNVLETPCILSDKEVHSIQLLNEED